MSSICASQPDAFRRTLAKAMNWPGGARVNTAARLPKETKVINRIVLGVALTFSLTGTVLAGPCTTRIADLERTIETSTAQGAKASPAPGDASSAQNKSSSEGMNMLQQAKELDKQGKEAECMDVVAKVTTTKAPLVNQ